MEEKNWTPMQRLAIDTKDKTLLVSAAAGSGKTATLIERIFTTIKDEKTGVKVEDILIVTFTNAAVGELRDRIGKKLQEEIEKNPENTYLSRQLLMLPAAKIRTIDSFCADILRTNCDRVGVNPNFRIADTAEAELLAESVLDGIFTAIYEGELSSAATPEELENLSACLTDSRSQGDLAQHFRLLYKDLECTELGVESLDELVEEFNPSRYDGVEKTKMGDEVMNATRSFAEHYERILSGALADLNGIPDPKLDKCRDVVIHDLFFLSSLKSARTYSEARDIFLGTKLLDSVSPGKKYVDMLPPITDIRTDMKSEVLGLKEGIFYCSEEHFRLSYEGLYSTLGTLVKILKEFERVFLEEKLRRGILQYSDVERFTLKCLVEEGEPTDVALSQRSQYEYVYIDEYQDVNSLQHRIFEEISRPDNRFMVGDIKQSIYRFRSANPDIFAKMKKTYPKLVSDSEKPYASIFMSENFRCDESVIDFVNEVFDRLFGLTAESIGYEDSDRLNFAKEVMGEVPYRRPEICLVEKDVAAFAVKECGIPGIESAAALAVAEKIKGLINKEKLNNGEYITAGDIAIIVRNAKGFEGDYALALERLGIPYVTAEQKTFFMNSEVLLALCLLNSIDNPERDIYLAGLMCSPLYGFTPDELALMRKEGEGSLYSCLKSYVLRHHDFVKGEKFIKALEGYRMFAEGATVDELIARLYHETAMLALAAKNGGKENLLLLYEYARRFERSSYKGLYNFINYINGILDRKSDFDKRSAPTDANAVKIITAHSSKGLEYPVVFFTEAQQKLRSNKDSTPRLIYDEGFGLGMNLRSPSGLALVENPTKHIVLEHRHKKRVEEEMRLLYVALTRARERLYVVGELGSKYDEFIKGAERLHEYLDSHSVYTVSHYLDMILSAVGTSHKTVTEFLSDPPHFFKFNTGGGNEEENAPEEKEEVTAEKEKEAFSDRELEELLVERFSFKYPREHLTRLPEKMSVSRLYPEILDGSESEPQGEMPEEEGCAERLRGELESKRLGALPLFAGGTDERKSAKMGIATHLLLQFCDLDELYSKGAAAELERLFENRFISDADRKLVRLDEVELFRKSELLEKMRSAKKLYRELRFNVSLPAELFASKEESKALYRDEKILVQGVIDCLIEDSEGELHLVDYKTDRLTREEKNNPELAAKKLKAAHSEQLGYYAEAVCKMFGKRPKTVEVYSLPLGTTCEV